MRRGLCTEGNLRYKVDWASLFIVGIKFMCHCTFFALFYFLFEKIRWGCSAGTLEPLVYTIAS